MHDGVKCCSKPSTVAVFASEQKAVSPFDIIDDVKVPSGGASL